MKRKIPGFTLLELIIALVLMSLLSLSYFQVDYFSRFQVLNADRKTKLQNEITLTLEHIAKNAAMAINHIASTEAEDRIAAFPTTIAGDPAIKICVDSNANSRRDDADRVVAYRFTGPSGTYQIWYYSRCTGLINSANCGSGSVGPEILSRQISAFTRGVVSGNIIDIDISARWKPAEAASIENPTVNMRARLSMPAVSNR